MHLSKESMSRQIYANHTFFHRSELLNTEINITTFPRPIIKSAHSVGTFERRFSRSWFKHGFVKLEAYVSTVIMGNINLPKPSQPFRFIQSRQVAKHSML